MREKTYVDDIDRSVYDIRDAEHDAYRMEAGLTPAIVEKLSQEKNDPVWMQQFRLHSLQIYNEAPLPDWGPSLAGSGHGPYRHLRPAQRQNAERLEKRASGHQGYL